MNKIEKLIAELCPNGVNYLPLEDFLTIRNGKDHKHLEDGKIPVYGSGGIMRHANQAAASGPSVLIPRKGSLGNLFYVEEPFWVVDTIFRTEINEDIALPKFVFYELQTLGLGEMNQAGGVPSQTQSKLKKLRIPIPPLPIQQEIVNILDKFQALEAELEAELEARKKQYEFYRDQLLTFTERERERVRWSTLSDIGTLIRGGNLQKKDFTESGVGCIHYGQIYTHYGIWTTKTKSFVSQEFAAPKRKMHSGDIFIATTSENDDDLGKSTAWLGNSDIVTSGDGFIFRHNQNPKYISYFINSPLFHKQINKGITGTKVRRISAVAIGKVKIPIPPLEEQQRIVNILDKFDALVNDLTSGLPAEIEARRKQYEYYRDQLLTFKELSA